MCPDSADHGGWTNLTPSPVIGSRSQKWARAHWPYAEEHVQGYALQHCPRWPKWSLPDTYLQASGVETRRELLGGWCGSPTTYCYNKQAMELCR